MAPDLIIKTIYRRQDVEGPINDAWTSLKLVTERGGRGELCVVECRKEWLGGGSRQVRSWFIEEWRRVEHVSLYSLFEAGNVLTWCRVSGVPDQQ